MTVTADPTADIWLAAKRWLPQGVASDSSGPAGGFDPAPVFAAEAEGAYVMDVAGRRFLDLLSSFGASILGHRPALVIEAVSRAYATVGFLPGLPIPAEAHAAELAVSCVPAWDRVRFTNSGAEAVMTAVRLARAATDRPLIVRFEGHFHGLSDALHWSARPDPSLAGPPRAPLPVPGTGGLPGSLAQSLVVQPWNDFDAIAETFAAHGQQIAGVVCEPVMGNCGVIMPRSGYLEHLRRLCDDHGSLLIFDEVKTGFRVHLGGAQALLGVTPDLSTAGKAIAAGFPVAAVGGRREVMGLIESGRVWQSSTYQGNPAAIAAITATLTHLASTDTIDRVNAQATLMADDLAAAFGRQAAIVRCGSLIGIHHGLSEAPIDYRSSLRPRQSDTRRDLARLLRGRGVLIPPGSHEPLYLNAAHQRSDLASAATSIAEALDALDRMQPIEPKE